MNERDTEIICGMMMQEGYTPVSSADEADLIIYNTCSVRKHAEDRVWGNIEQLKRLKVKKLKGSKVKRLDERAEPIIGLVGCMGKAYGEDIFKRLPHVDFICGPSNIYDIPDLVERVKEGKRHIVAIGAKRRPLRKDEGRYRDESVRAWVNIGEGCDNFCSYCIVPYVRGREVSRPESDILDEIKGLVDKGIKEVTLLGQNVNSYKETDANFIKLLERINKIEGLKRIRFMTSHPKDADLKLFEAMKNLDKVCEHLHLPLQSGSDKILKAMNRKYTVSHYLKLIDLLRKEIPDCAVSTDIIVGFPGETEKDFMDTYMVMKRIGFDSAFIFKYSPRPFTKASEMKDDIEKKTKEERNQVLLNLQDKITGEKNQNLIGTIHEAMGIRGAKRKPGSSYELSAFYIKARTRRNRQVVYKGTKDLIGAVCDVKINEVEEHTLIGELV